MAKEGVSVIMPFYQGTTTSANLMNELLSKITAVQPGETEPWWINESTDPNHVVLTSKGSSGNARIVVWMTPYPQYGFIRVRIARDYIPGAAGELGTLVDYVPYQVSSYYGYGLDVRMRVSYYFVDRLSGGSNPYIVSDPIPETLHVSYYLVVQKDYLILGLIGDPSYYDWALPGLWYFVQGAGSGESYYVSGGSRSGASSDVVFAGMPCYLDDSDVGSAIIVSTCNTDVIFYHTWASVIYGYPPAGVDATGYELTMVCALDNVLGQGRIENYYSVVGGDNLEKHFPGKSVLLTPIGMVHPTEGYRAVLGDVCFMQNSDLTLRHGDIINVGGSTYVAFKKIPYGNKQFSGADPTIRPALDKTGWLAIRKS